MGCRNKRKREQDAVRPVGGREEGLVAGAVGKGKGGIKTGLHYCCTLRKRKIKGIGTRPVDNVRTRNRRRNNKTTYIVKSEETDKNRQSRDHTPLCDR